MSLMDAVRAEAWPLLQRVGSRRVVVWGAGDLGSWLMQQLGAGGIGFVDANPAKHRTQIAGRSVWPVEDLPQLPFDEVWVSVLSDVEAICEHLEGLGLGEDRVFRVVFPSAKQRQFEEMLPRYLSFFGRFELPRAEVLEVGFGGQLFLAITLLWLGAEHVVATDVTPQRRALERRRAQWLRYLRWLAEHHPGHPGVELDPEALLDRIRLHPQGVSASELPFPDQPFDAVVNTGVMEHVDDPHRAIAEFARVLRPGGLALCAAIGIHDHRANDPRSGFTPWSFLQVPDEAWAELGGGAYHQNRWRAVDFDRSFAGHGLRVLHRQARPDPRLRPEEVRTFAERFRRGYTLAELSELDLWIAAEAPQI